MSTTKFHTHTKQQAKLMFYLCAVPTYLQEMGLGGMDWIDLVQDREKGRAVVNAVMNLRVP